MDTLAGSILPRLLVERHSLNVLLPAVRQVYFTASDSMASRYITNLGMQPDHSSPTGHTTLVRRTSGKTCHDCCSVSPTRNLLPILVTLQICASLCYPLLVIPSRANRKLQVSNSASVCTIQHRLWKEK